MAHEIATYGREALVTARNSKHTLVKDVGFVTSKYPSTPIIPTKGEKDHD